MIMTLNWYPSLYLALLALSLSGFYEMVIAEAPLPPPTPRITPPPSSSRPLPIVEHTTSCYRVIANGTGVEMWQQCGGKSYTGPTTCISGGECIYVNEHYSSCQPISSAVVRCS